jgi:Domain of unknown function (DUF4062)
MYKVFLSSTSRDLAAYREAVHQAIDGLDGFHLVAMEHFGARDASARDLCEKLVRQSWSGCSGTIYGSRPQGEDLS